MAPDPYAHHHEEANRLLAAGEIVKAGQIWQAILKQVPEHAAAQAGLLKVREGLWAQQQAALAQAPPEDAFLSATETPKTSPEGYTLIGASDPTPPGGQPQVSEASPEAVAPAMAEAAAAPDPAPAHPEPEPKPEPEASPTRPSDETRDRLLREGCTLYDMGQLEDALLKWESLLRMDPDNALARGYVEDARKELGLPPLGSGIPAAPASQVEEASGPSQEAIEAAEKLVREGCLLWDMGLSEEATGKWRKALELAPHHHDIRQYLDQAERDLADASATQALVTSSPDLTVPIHTHSGSSPALNETLETKLRQAEHLLGLQRYEEAAFSLQQALRIAPGDPRVLDALRRCSPDATSQIVHAVTPGTVPKPARTPVLVEMDPDAFERTNPGLLSEAVSVPASVTRPAAPVRAGLSFGAPRVLEQLQGLEMLRDPKVWAITAGILLLLIGGGTAIQSWRKDAQLKTDVEEARQAALSQASKAALVPDLVPTHAQVLAEAREALSSDPVRSYLLAQFLLKQNPGNAEAAQLFERAKKGLGSGGVAGASLEEFQKHLAGGNLEAAQKVMDALLRAQPENQDLRTKASRMERALAEDHANQGHFEEARLHLLRARALMPEDSGWNERLRLLEQMKSMSKAQRSGWAGLLG